MITSIFVSQTTVQLLACRGPAWCISVSNVSQRSVGQPRACRGPGMGGPSPELHQWDLGSSRTMSPFCIYVILSEIRQSWRYAELVFGCLFHSSLVTWEFASIRALPEGIWRNSLFHSHLQKVWRKKGALKIWVVVPRHPSRYSGNPSISLSGITPGDSSTSWPVFSFS